MTAATDGPHGRSELLFWFNSLCSAEYPSVEALRDGAAYCAVVAAALRQGYADASSTPATLDTNNATRTTTITSPPSDSNQASVAATGTTSQADRPREDETRSAAAAEDTTGVSPIIAAALARLDWSVTPRVRALVDPAADDGLVRAACRHNFLILQDLLRRAVPPAWTTSISVDRLAEGKLQDHVRLLQWLYRFLARVLLRRSQLVRRSEADDALVHGEAAGSRAARGSGAVRGDSAHTPPPSSRRHGTVEGVRLNRAVRLLEQKRHGVLLTPAKEPRRAPREPREAPLPQDTSLPSATRRAERVVSGRGEDDDDASAMRTSMHRSYSPGSGSRSTSPRSKERHFRDSPTRSSLHAVRATPHEDAGGVASAYTPGETTRLSSVTSPLAQREELPRALQTSHTSHASSVRGDRAKAHTAQGNALPSATQPRSRTASSAATAPSLHTGLRHAYYVADSSLVPAAYKTALLDARRAVEAIERAVWRRHTRHGACLAQPSAAPVSSRLMNTSRYDNDAEEEVEAVRDSRGDKDTAVQGVPRGMPSLAELGQLLRQRDELALLHARVEDVVRRAQQRRAGLSATGTASSSALLSDLSAILRPS